ncbi:MAG: ABC transporter permease, partial [Acidimicrobiia bacterium]|nr:ABC transporter permease [Acidimicrobiia bacterium]
ASRGRIVAMVLLGLVGLFVGFVIGATADSQLSAWVRFVNSFGLSLLVPVVSLLFASAAFSNPIEDGTLVYLWLRPIERSRLVLAAYAASLTIIAPLVVVPLALGTIASRAGTDALAGTVAAALVGAVGYSALFLGLGLLTRRGLPWGLAYILIWEGFVASASSGASRLALRAYTRSILSEATDVTLRLANVSLAAAMIVPLVVAMVALALTSARLQRADVP